MMIATWYAIVSFMLITYVALDGRNSARECSIGLWPKPRRNDDKS